ncbi:HupE/UreJ family protein [Spongiimicrobium salis]|uniref:HupE/UreJ family protein n=1 Tax=Spongiimicrobium salis TaxID=1667022 RepID=UPI00374D7956
MLEDITFYTKLGLDHVLDFNAYDHMLFLAALAIPFTFKNWKNVLALVTVFTITHCLSLVLAVYELIAVNVEAIEFAIPITIILTCIFNLRYAKEGQGVQQKWFHLAATAFFGLIHGFGFSNYFKLIISGEEEKLMPLLSFALGIELSQVLIILVVLLLTYVLQDVIGLRKKRFIQMASFLVIAVTTTILVKMFL